jgi:pimeloyl-ACP methyl ester carboxylesterase
MPTDTTVHEADADLGAVRIHYTVAGPADGRPVVLLHGFPESRHAWHRQLPGLAAAGYRVVAPDLRGYDRSSKPAGIDAYAADRVAADVAGLLAHLGHERAAVVGHDWGGVIALTTAMEHAGRVSRLVVLNAPYPSLAGGFSFRQALRSWYAAFFQLPAVPEWVLRAGDYALLARLFEEDAAPGAYTEADVERYREGWRRSGSLTAMLNYYRAFGRDTLGRLLADAGAADQRVEAPSLVLWGQNDTALGPGVCEHLVASLPAPTVERFRASHWLHAERPDAVTDALLDFLD